ncbi:MAG: hypothetical protein ACQESF_06305 [Nanobdellota archaeon]
MVKKIILSALVLLFLLASAVSAQDQIVINSRNWEDVYSGMIYSKINDIEANYPTEESRAQILLDSLDKGKENLLLIESSEPFISNYRAELAAEGFEVEEFNYEDSINLELARESNFTKFIVMDSRFAYNAVSIAPFASLKNYYVIFADQFNINTAVEILEEKAEEVIQYGYVDREVNENLARFNPEKINEGSKYKNNVEIVKRFLKNKNTSQFILTNGKFIEPQFFENKYPIVFIGSTNTPDITMEFLKESNIKHGVLIGNELVDLATALKNRADMKIMVKFAKGINQKQYTLDIIELPTPDYNPVVNQAFYNTLAQELVITLENQGETPVMIKGSYTLSSNNETVATVGDQEVIFVPGEGISTQTYDIELDEEKTNLKANILYGEDKSALENLNVINSNVDFIEVNDESNITIDKVFYDKTIKRFVIKIKNTGKQTTYATGLINDFLLNEREQRLSTDKIIEILPGDSEILKIKADLSPLDIEENENINLELRYGGQKNMLLKEKNLQKELIVKSSTALYAGIALGAFIIAILLIFYTRKNKKK